MSLDLDDRQRAMLREMGVRVWWPKAPVEDAEKLLVKDFTEISDQKLAKIISNSGATNAIISRPIADIIKIDDKKNIYSVTEQDLSALTWPQLRQTVSACRACGLCEGRTQTVFGVGQSPSDDTSAPQVDWLIVGEAPGENEDRVGEPFVGQAGQLLDNMLKAMKLSRQKNVYIANVIKCRPPGNRNPSPQEVAQCEPYLHRQIALLRPKMILALGKFAATSLLRGTVPEVDKMPLGKLRGQVHSYSHGGLIVPVVASYHPAYLLRSLTEKAKAWEDLCLALAAMEALEKSA